MAMGRKNRNCTTLIARLNQSNRKAQRTSVGAGVLDLVSVPKLFGVGKIELAIIESSVGAVMRTNYFEFAHWTRATQGH
jgi:hypothetical protein